MSQDESSNAKGLKPGPNSRRMRGKQDIVAHAAAMRAKLLTKTKARQEQAKAKARADKLQIMALAGESDLPPRHEAFCREYLIDLNATHAAIRAGYEPSGAKNAGWNALARPDVAKRIAQLRHELERAYIVNQADVVRFLVEDRAMARELGQMGPAIRASELLGKRFGMFMDRSLNLEVTVTDGDLIQRLAQGDATRAASVRHLLGNAGFSDDAEESPESATE